MKNKKLSAVVPVYNEAEGITRFFAALDTELKKLALASYEVVLVNDGSSDSTAHELKLLKEAHPSIVRVINLTRNFGKEAALSAGLHSARGDVVLTLDADGQHPPKRIRDFLEIFYEGHDMVVGLRSSNVDEKRLKKLGNKLYYHLLKVTGIFNLQPQVTDFRLMSREVVDEFCKLTERRRITRGLIDWMGFDAQYIEFAAEERIAGNATYNFKKLTYLAIDSILANSRKPLAASILLGCLMTGISFVGALLLICNEYVFSDALGLNVTGSAVLALIILFMIGILLISQGIMSLYLARIYEEVQQRPLYVINRAKSSEL
jgi:polyisoprenyl-phosphate glycosyltransferase